MSRGRFCAEEERDEDKIENIIQPPLLSFFGRIILDCFGCSIYLLSISIVILFSFRFVSAVLDLPVDTLRLFFLYFPYRSVACLAFVYLERKLLFLRSSSYYESMMKKQRKQKRKRERSLE
ncbi:hypothetical protein M432DRAFT_614513 [Thermoascus aurantiacus ATCC 26904]